MGGLNLLQLTTQSSVQTVKTAVGRQTRAVCVLCPAAARRHSNLGTFPLQGPSSRTLRKLC